MDKKFTNGAKRIFAALLAMIIVSSGVPVSPLSQVFGDTVITANAEDSWSKSEANTVFGTTGIEHPQTPQENVEWRGNYVYYGKYNGNPVKYRILDADSQEFVPKKSGNIEPEDPTQKTLFLESDSFVGTDVDWNFGEKRYTWPSSVLRRQLTKDPLFYNKEGVFTPIEKASIFTSVKLGRIWDGEKADGVGYSEDMNFAALFGDTIFVLDAREATNPYYGYANTRYAHKSKSRGGWHWLRSPYDQYKGMVESDGNIEARSLMYSNVCPAFNVDLKKVLFSSRIVGDASAAYGKEYKLTLKNDNFGIGITDGDYVTYNSSSRWVSIPYTVTDSDDNINPDTVSIVITNLNGDIVYYSPVSDTYKSKGTAWVQLPTNEPSKYHVYLVAENRNGIHETDYASPMTEIHVPTTYAITYKLNGGTNNPQNPPNYIDDYGTEIYAPTRERYNFGGWYDNSAFTGEPITSIPAGSSDRKILYAKWIPCIYNVTLIKNGGTIDGDDLTQYTYTYGAVLPGIKKDYYTFKGWFARDKYGNELKYTKISTSSYGDKSFYANWTANTYTIGYELNGGTADNPTSYTAENLPINLNNPTRTGYTFTGWTGTEIAGTSQNVAISDCSAGNRNYTANWSVNHYTVKFDKNNANASGTMTDQNFTCNMEQELTANGFTAPTGYHFIGWATTPNGNAVYTDEQPILNMTTEDNKEITLYAKWAANTYTIHFDKNSDLAYGEMPDQVFTYDAAPEKLSKRAFIFTTAAFLGWNTKADGSGTSYSNEQKVRNLTTVNDEVITLYAQWKREYGVFDNSDNSDLFYFRVAGGTQNSYWFFPDDTVQIYKKDNNNKYVIQIIDKDKDENEEGYIFKKIDEINDDNPDYTFTMPEKNLYVTIGDTVITDIGNIAEISLDNKESWEDVVYLYNANNPTVTPTVTVECNGQTLTENTDYTLEIVNNTGSSDHMVEAAVIVTGKGRYCGTTTKTFRITPYDIADCEIKGTLEAYDNGYGPFYPLCNNVEVWNGNTKLTCDTDYIIELDPALDIYDDYEVGQTYTATLKGCGDWGGSTTFTFTFVALSHSIVFDANGGTGTMENAKVGNPGRYYLPECAFDAPYGYEFDYWTAGCEIDEDTGLPVHKQPGNYFTAPYIWSESYVQTITVKAYWKEKAKYTVTLPENMELISGIIDDNGKAYKDEVITFKTVDGYSVFGDVTIGDTVLTPNENGIYTVTVTADTAVTATVLDNNTCYFDATTSTLHLRGNVTTADVQQYKDTALSVVAEVGAVLPEDSSYLFSDFSNATSINLANADTSNVTNMMYMFYNCKSLTTLDLSNFDTSSVTDMYGMFRYCEKLTSLDLSSFDTSSVTDMSIMFCDCYALTSVNLSGFDTSGVTNMNWMFCDCHALTSLDLSSFDTSSVTGMSVMFGNCYALTSLDLSSFDTSSVTDMSYMFNMNITENSLTTIYVSENWNTDNVTDSTYMFQYCKKLKGGNGTTFDSNNVDKTYAVIDGQAGQAGYLTGTYALTLSTDKIVIVTDDTENKVGDRYVGGAVVKLKYTGSVPDHNYASLKVRYSDYLPDENDIYTVTITDNTYVAVAIRYCQYTVTIPDNMEFVSAVSDTYIYSTPVSFKAKDGYAVKGDVKANGITLDATNGIYTLYVTGNMTVSADVDVESYFDFTTGTLTLKGTVLKNSGYYTSLILPDGVNKNNVLHIAVDSEGATLPQNSSCLFCDFSNVQSIDLTGADTSNVTDMRSMFEDCQALTTLDLSSFDTSSVTNMWSMFGGCYALETLDLSDFDTSSVTYMGFMFQNCSALETLDLSSFDTSSVMNMNYMFCNCYALETLDLSSFDTSSVMYMDGMFEMEETESIDNSLTTIYVGKNWNTDNIETYTTSKTDIQGNTITVTSSYDTDMFYNCTRLTGGNGTVYDSEKTDKTYARIDEVGQPGYLTGLYNLTLPEHMEIVTYDAENKVGNRYLRGAEVTFKVKTGYGASNVQANGTDLTADENGIYTVSVTDDTEITANIVAYTPVVINSVDINVIATPTTVYKEIYTSTDYTVPASPYLDGYTFSGWTVNDTLYTTADTVQTAVYDLVKAGTPVTVEVVYEKKVGKHKVYVSAGTLENGETEFEYDISELVKITAYEGAEGQVFSYWERDGKAVSYNKTYSFYMPDGDVHLSAIYGNVQPAQATGFIENVTANADTRKISFVSVINVPENCTLVKGGLVATKNPDIGEAVTDKNAAFVKLSAKATADTKNLKYTWTKANVGENDIWYVRSYVVFIDTNNVEQTQYSDAVKADLSGRITG